MGNQICAHRAVILAAGDFTNDPELKSRYMGPREAKAEAVNETATGASITNVLTGSGLLRRSLVLVSFAGLRAQQQEAQSFGRHFFDAASSP